MNRYSANTQLKMLFYIAAIAFGIYYVGTKFNLIEFDKLVEYKKDEETEEVEQKEEEDLVISNIKVTVENSSGQEVQLDLEVAQTDSEKSQGLMYRKTLGEYQGMFFVYQAEVNYSFWMRNTLIPLDMIFLSSDGVVVDIEKNAQPCVTEACPHYQSDEMFRYAIEVNGRWTDTNKVAIGAEFDISEFTSGT